MEDLKLKTHKNDNIDTFVVWRDAEGDSRDSYGLTMDDYCFFMCAETKELFGIEVMGFKSKAIDTDMITDAFKVMLKNDVRDDEKLIDDFKEYLDNKK